MSKETETEDEVSKEDLMSKPFSQWSAQEREKAQEMNHTLPVSVYAIGRMQQYGQKGMSWDKILRRILDKAGDTDE